VLELKGIGKTIGFRKILKDVNLTFEEGGRYLVVGPNGAGKTTLLNIISGLTRPTEGKVFYRGEEIGTIGEKYRSELGYLTHEFSFYEELSGFENLFLFARLYRVDSPRERALELLEYFKLSLWRDEPVGHYSHGMKKRLSIAKVFLHLPPIILLDEPFSGLDEEGVRLVMELIKRQIPQKGVLIISSHLPTYGLNLCQYFIKIESGKIKAVGSKEDFQ